MENEVKFQAFGKTRGNRKKPMQKATVKDADSDKELIAKQSERIQSEILKSGKCV